ncbi:hypothetical protein D3C72_2277760 [compost metagenome]
MKVIPQRQHALPGTVALTGKKTAMVNLGWLQPAKVWALASGGLIKTISTMKSTV